MANFSTPFAQNAGRRLPTADEKINGFPCGPADQTLFNGLFHRLEAELGSLISFAGLTPSDAENNQVRQAVEALISAATGGGDTSQFFLMSQARARLPIFPVIDTVDGKINVTSPATGIVRLPGNLSFIHRGVFPITTTETDFATSISRTYHLRWNTTDGFVLKDLTDTSYNPGSAVETDAQFDSTYDDMLIARVVTNSSNVVTITNLVNLPRMSHEVEFDQALNNTDESWASLSGTAVTLNWSRTPDLKTISLSGVQSYNSNWRAHSPSLAGMLGKLALRNQAVNRYGSVELQYNYDDSIHNHGRAMFTRSFVAMS